jgi:hypothetical protein
MAKKKSALLSPHFKSNSATPKRLPPKKNRKIDRVKSQPKPTPVQPVYSEHDSEAVRVVVNSRDLTERKRTEEALSNQTRILQFIDMTMHAVQRISAELRPGMLDDLGLAAAIEWQAEQFRERTGIDCEVTLNPENTVKIRGGQDKGSIVLVSIPLESS